MTWVTERYKNPTEAQLLAEKARKMLHKLDIPCSCEHGETPKEHYFVFPSNQQRIIKSVNGAYVVYDQDDNRISSYGVECEAVEACTDALTSIMGGKIITSSGSEIRIEHRTPSYIPITKMCRKCELNNILYNIQDPDDMAGVFT